jgi:uncharacterized protein (DUF427 family)
MTKQGAIEIKVSRRWDRDLHVSKSYFIPVLTSLRLSATVAKEYHRTNKIEEFDMKATWHGATLAESDDTVVVEGNHYFPSESINKELFSASEKHSTCPWKGEASYYDIVVNGEVNKDAAWYYPEPKDAAKNITGHVAFWKGVEVN